MRVLKGREAYRFEARVAKDLTRPSYAIPTPKLEQARRLVKEYVIQNINQPLSLSLNDIIAWISAEAKARLEQSPECPGGLAAKYHAVLMEIGLKIGEKMKR